MPRLFDAISSTSHQTALRALCVYCFAKRVLLSKFRFGVYTMRDSRKQFYRAMWKDSADSIDAGYSEMARGMAEIRLNGLAVRVCENKTSFECNDTLQLARDKSRVRLMLAEASLPIPRQVQFKVGQFQTALAFLRSSKFSLVVKPAADTGAGAGVSTNIKTSRQLRDAVAWARAYGPKILAEDQIEGDCYRVLVMEGEVVDVVIRRPPLITGDGRSTVRQLIKRENLLRRRAGIGRAQVLIRFDPDLRNTLATQKLRLTSRPAADVPIVLKRVINDNGTADNRPANNILCSAILESACKAAHVIGARLAGVDLICSDPSIPLEHSGGAIIEVNVNPGLYYHYSSERNNYPITKEVLSRFFRNTLYPSVGQIND